MFKKSFIAVLFLLFLPTLRAQDGTDAFLFLKLPFSSHASALGGENISIIEDDLTMAVQNPALLSCVADKTLNLNYMLYMDGINVAGAAFARSIGKRSTWAVTTQYVDYGEMKETTEENIETGTFSAKDISISGIYTYDLSDYWSGGVRTNFIYSHYDKYSSFAIGVDLGLNYYHQESDFSASLVTRNLGGQLKTFEERHEELPVDVQLGFSKGLAHAPFRFSFTLHDLTHWNAPVMATNNFGKKLLNHIALGIDFLPTNNFYIAAGYNFRRGEEMKINGSSHWAGFSCGMGIRLKRLKLDMAYAKYHVSSSSLIFNLSYTL
ncbi:type IX secretion system protein PorQ [Bacteroides sp. UBA939]|uniref:type IX secretion system protein PorQ n=1 Tax=Bacteroides sp. UBA939 TaxID=1946092 RepID=UPI0025BEF41E|nr:type IX secretion system protein PorQ [Bacteroides sp. UBA939]